MYIAGTAQFVYQRAATNRRLGKVIDQGERRLRRTRSNWIERYCLGNIKFDLADISIDDRLGGQMTLSFRVDLISDPGDLNCRLDRPPEGIAPSGI